MSIKNIVPALFVGLGLTLTILLVVRSWQTPKSTLEITTTNDPTSNIHLAVLSQDSVRLSNFISSDSLLSGSLSSAQEVFDYGLPKGMISMDQQALFARRKIEEAVDNEGIMGGVRILLGLVASDSNHVLAIQTLAEMSVRSGQAEKAIKRYQKLLTLQPENVEFKRVLQDLQN
ncbi:MAG: hypothetical protein ACI8ZN_000109 [Bacteroidia bacterium]